MEAPRPGRMNAPGTTESAEVLARARAGDTEAWGDLYRMYAPAIFRFCRRALPTREDAEDATTEVFMKVRDKLHQYDATRPFTSWLYKVADRRVGVTGIKTPRRVLASRGLVLAMPEVCSAVARVRRGGAQ